MLKLLYRYYQRGINALPRVCPEPFLATVDGEPLIPVALCHRFTRKRILKDNFKILILSAKLRIDIIMV